MLGAEVISNSLSVPSVDVASTEVIRNTRVPTSESVEHFDAVMAEMKMSSMPTVSMLSEVWRQTADTHLALRERLIARIGYGSKRELSLVELSAVQYDLINLTLRQEIITQVAKKATDAVSTLVKNG